MVAITDGKDITHAGYGLFVHITALNDEVTVNILHKTKITVLRGKDDDKQFCDNIYTYLYDKAGEMPIRAVSVNMVEDSEFTRMLCEKVSLTYSDTLFIPNAIIQSEQYGIAIDIPTLWARIEARNDWVYTQDALRAATLDQLIGLAMRSADAFNFEYNRLRDRAVDIVHSSTVVGDDLVMFGPETSIRELSITENEIRQLNAAGITTLGSLLENKNIPNRKKLIKGFRLTREIIHENIKY